MDALNNPSQRLLFAVKKTIIAVTRFLTCFILSFTNDKNDLKRTQIHQNYDKPIFLRLSKKYVDTIGNEDAERRFTQLAKEYTDAMKDGYRDVRNSRVVKNALEMVTGKTVTPVANEVEQFNAIVKEYERKAQELAREYIRDENVMDEIHKAAIEDARNDIPLLSEKEQIAIQIIEKSKSKSNGMEY